MNLNINLPADVENAMRKRAAAERTDLATFVTRIVAESVVDEERPTNKKRSPEEFARRLDAWIAMHPVLDHVIDDSRESFYAGREG